jgi:hypothetical protein
MLEVAPGVYVHGTREAISILQARLAAPVPAALDALLDRIQNYLGNGGLFNPELMDHDKVRDLMLDCRAALRAAGPRRTDDA